MATITTTTEAIETLACDYSAFMRAVREKDWSGIRIWGPRLKISQAACGVDLVVNLDSLLAADLRCEQLAVSRADAHKAVGLTPYLGAEG